MTFEFLEPTRLNDAVAMLADRPDAARPFAGGTALLNLIKLRLAQPTALISLRRIPGLHAITREAGGGLRIGALVPIRDLELSPAVRAAAPVLVEAARCVATVSVRNKATLGGSLCHADPRSDLPPALLALDATVIVHGPKGEREMPAASFARGEYETALAPGEILAAVRVPALPADAKFAYRRFTTHSLAGHPMAGVAVVLRADGDGCREAHIGVSAVSPAPYRATAAEGQLAGQTLDDRALLAAGEAAAAAADPHDDLHGSAAYKRQIARVLVADTLAAAVGRTLA